MYACLEDIKSRYRCTYSYVCCSCHEDMRWRKKEVTCRQHQCRAAVYSLPGWRIPGKKTCLKNVCFSMWKYKHNLCGQNSEDSFTSAWQQGALRSGTATVASVGWPVEDAVKERDMGCVLGNSRSGILTESELVAKSVSSFHYADIWLKLLEAFVNVSEIFKWKLIYMQTTLLILSIGKLNKCLITLVLKMVKIFCKFSFKLT